jgi:hypothetical protein
MEIQAEELALKVWWNSSRGQPELGRFLSEFGEQFKTIQSVLFDHSSSEREEIFLLGRALYVFISLFVFTTVHVGIIHEFQCVWSSSLGEGSFQDRLSFMELSLLFVFWCRWCLKKTHKFLADMGSLISLISNLQMPVSSNVLFTAHNRQADRPLRLMKWLILFRWNETN